MKRILVTFLLVVLALSVLAQVPQAFKYQTVVRDNTGEILDNQDVYFRISILQYTDSGDDIYVETFDCTTNDFGLVTFNIGEGDVVVEGIFENIDWSDGPYFVKVEVDADGPGTTYSYDTAGTNQLLSVPYALHSITAEESSDTEPLASQISTVSDRLVGANIGLVLWNRLGSVAEVQNSETGPNGSIVGSVNFNNDVKFGKGLTPNTGNAGSGVDFPCTIVNPDQGCVEMWAEFYFAPIPFSYGVYGFVNVSHWTHNVMSFAWHNDGSILQMVLQFNGTGRDVTLSSFSPTLNTPVHLACVWDRDGIDGTSDFMRIYVDGSLVKSNSSYNDWGTNNSTGSFRVAAPWDASFATDRYSVDNIKIWNYAKTSFDDRFTDNPSKAGDRILSSSIDNIAGTGTISYGIVDANSTGIGAALYIAADGNFEEADADAAATMPCVALALETGTGSKKILLQGYIRNDLWTWTPGGLIYVSPATGALTQTILSTTGQQVQIVGYALKASTIYFNPNLMLIEIK